MSEQKIPKPCKLYLIQNTWEHRIGGVFKTRSMASKFICKEAEYPHMWDIVEVNGYGIIKS